jgi:hypothetical protein
MATRSRIGIQNQDGSVTSIYCHWDGYPSGNGKTLVQHYMDRRRVEALIALGNISQLEDLVHYRHRAGQSFNTRLDKSVEEYFASDLEDYGYLFTLENKWVCICGKTRQEIALNELCE